MKWDKHFEKEKNCHDSERTEKCPDCENEKKSGFVVCRTCGGRGKISKGHLVLLQIVREDDDANSDYGACYKHNSMRYWSDKIRGNV